MPKYLIFALLLTNLREFGGTILRGTRAGNDQFPWLIQFHTISPCGGVLITPDWVLTAAQCVQYKRNSIVLYATGLNGTGSSQTVSVKATYIYPEFKGYSEVRDYDNNIALLKLIQPFDMCNPKVRLLDIASVRLDDDYKSCLIFGWQSTVAPSSKVHAKPIQFSHVLLNTWRLCRYMHKGNASYRNVFCTQIEDENGMKACAGNPGSPVVCEDQHRRMVLLGIASWSNYSLDCGGLPTYLDVSVFRSWMWQLIFGDKNIDHWEIENDERQPCNRQAKMDQHAKIHNHTERENNRDRYDSDMGERENEYAFDKRKSSRGKHDPGIEARFGAELESPIFFDQINDYAGISHPGNSRIDVVRDREEQLSQYREIGRIPHLEDDTDKELIAVPSQLEKVAYIDEKFRKTNFPRRTAIDESENFDVLELVMPDGIEDLNRSSSTSNLCIRNSNRFYIMLFPAIAHTLLR